MSVTVRIAPNSAATMTTGIVIGNVIAAHRCQLTSLKVVLKATVRSPGQRSHARLIYGLEGTKKMSASALGTGNARDADGAPFPISSAAGGEARRNDCSVVPHGPVSGRLLPTPT